MNRIFVRVSEAVSAIWASLFPSRKKHESVIAQALETPEGRRLSAIDWQIPNSPVIIDWEVIFVDKHLVRLNKRSGRNSDYRKEDIIYTKEISKCGVLLFAYMVKKDRRYEDHNEILFTRQGSGMLKFDSSGHRDCLNQIFIHDENVDQEFIDLVGIEEDHAATLRQIGDKYRV